MVQCVRRRLLPERCGNGYGGRNRHVVGYQRNGDAAAAKCLDRGVRLVDPGDVNRRGPFYDFEGRADDRTAWSELFGGWHGGAGLQLPIGLGFLADPDWGQLG